MVAQGLYWCLLNRLIYTQEVTHTAGLASLFNHPPTPSEPSQDDKLVSRQKHPSVLMGLQVLCLSSCLSHACLSVSTAIWPTESLPLCLSLSPILPFSLFLCHLCESLSDSLCLHPFLSAALYIYLTVSPFLFLSISLPFSVSVCMCELFCLFVSECLPHTWIIFQSNRYTHHHIFFANIYIKFKVS